MRKTNITFLIATLLLTSNLTFGQGCETLLMNGVFNTFSASSGNYSSAEWHNSWCNGTVEKVSSGSSTGASLNVVIENIPLGMSYDDAKEFQRIYKSIYCGTATGKTTDISTNSVIQKVASPDILSAYVKCKEIESGGLQVNLNVRPDDRKVFVVDVKFTKAWGTDVGPKVKKVSFVPNVISVREGTLQDGIGLKTGVTYSMICERSTDIPLTVYVETEVGTFIANLPPFIPPPTDQERIMNSMPKGTILGWFDATRIPKGWSICNGSAGTPNLVDKFPYGTGTVSDLGTTPPNSTAKHNHGINNVKTDGCAWGGGIGGNPRETGAIQLQGGDALTQHTHTINNKRTDDAEWLPPCTKIIFIMKL